MTIKMTRTATTLLTCLVLSACGGKKESVDGEPVTDITRPPQTVKDAAEEVQQETNPDETISYDEWRRRRQQEAEEADGSETP